ncbi:hypothetical protein P22_2260 [Propionispora sp. 2/2-37]|uniref:3D domain-containing protein n=1 Tax=Propionispora sp. 2/2-37 TaxID=1677858 RepID=UPI0006BB891D|nr:3D domain-containing protein [Propionispora sp. 2/2-37]CUH96172.1 hypothetical protein P22_2260 [Propionispora sp. 2/2-37]
MKKFFLMAVLTCLLLLTSTVVFAAPGDVSLKVGARGDDVQVLQRLLTEAGFYNGAIDGIFGNGTFRAVMDFQISNGLTVDGIAGRETFAYLNRGDSNSSRYSRSLVMKASAYSAYDPGNSSYTARGNLLRRGLVAVDPNVIPLGTRLYIPGYGYAIADDTGGAIRGNVIDLAFDSHAEAIQFGRQQVTVYILE